MPGRLDDDQLAERLSAWLDGEVTELRRLSGGASRETWSFCLDRHRRVLQRDRAGAVRTGGGMATEAVLVPLANDAGVPTPRLIAADVEGSHLGAPATVTEFVEGETIARRIQRDDEYEQARQSFASDAGAALARIHRLDTRSIPGLAEPDQVAQFREIFDAFDEANPAFELGFRWLERHRPPANETTVVHGDFRLGNLMLDGSGLVAVLDWELAHLGDPMEDLGWLCVRAWRFGGVAPVGGLGSYEDLFDAYAAEAGVGVDPEVVHWWEVLGTLKWGVMCMVQAASHLEGHHRSVELATIGRRVCENEYDLLRLIR